MEAKDLMIGDWVHYIGDDCTNDVNIRVREIHEDFVYSTFAADEFYYNELEPIPLTPEILEKSGFVNVENTQTSTIMYSFRDSLFRIEVYNFNHITIDSYYTDSSCDIFVSSVHEFQHALRLCKIEKEIIL